MKYKIFLLLVTTLFLSFSTYAQFNLKEKLNRKADQVTEDFLFGKKKKKSSSKNESSDSSGDEDYEYKSYQDTPDNSDEENNSLDNYKDKDVDWSSVESNDVVHFSHLLSLLPNAADGFKLSSKPEGATASFGESSYSTGSKELSKGDQQVDLILFDYKEVSSLYEASAQTYSYETTEGKSESIEVGGYKGQYVEDYEDKTTTLMLFVKGRYLYSASGDDVSKESLISITSKVNLDKLP